MVATSVFITVYASSLSFESLQNISDQKQRGAAQHFCLATVIIQQRVPFVWKNHPAMNPEQLHSR